MLKKWKSEASEKELLPMSLEQFNEEIDQALIDSKYDRGIEVNNLKLKYQ